jgi:hypothetical protein
MDITNFYLIVTMSFLFLSHVVADFDVYHNIKSSIWYPSISSKKLNFGMLPKGHRVPPSGPSTKSSDSPAPPPLLSSNLNFGMLPKGHRVPPSGPSTKSSDSPAPPPLPSSNLNFGMLPKGQHVPPSGASMKSSDSPPPLPSIYF